MYRRPSHLGSRAFGLLIFLALLIDLLLKDAADLQQIMWSCYWGAIAIASGMLLVSERLVAWGTVFFAGLGLPAWLLGLAFAPRTGVTSILMHTLPLVAGLIYIRTMPALPPRSVLAAWALYAIPFLLSWTLTSPREMINLSHWRRSAMPSLPFSTWQFYLLMLPLSLFSILLASWLINRWLLRRDLARLRLVIAEGDH